MNDKQLDRFLTTEWGYEDYKFVHNFNLDQPGFHFSNITKNGKELERPKVLYKYYSNKEYNLKALANGYLYFSSPRNFNDPFDCLTNRERFILRGGDEIVNHRNNIGVCCFSILNNNPLMWGHYTNNYKGFCLKYKNESFLNKKDISIRSHSLYIKDYEPANKNLSQLMTKVESSEIELENKDLVHKILKMNFEYCCKYYDWQYEKEYRAISWTTNNFERKFKISKEDTEEIYIGNKMEILDPDFYSELKNILQNEYPRIKIFKVKPHPLVIKIDFEQIKISEM